MTTDCLFCKIIRGELKTTFVYEDDKVIAFADIHPQAPTHFLIVPRQHISTLNDLVPNNFSIIAHMTQVAQQLASDYQHTEEGYRVVMNCNAAGGQSVFHIHMHLLAGRDLQWPPG